MPRIVPHDSDMPRALQTRQKLLATPFTRAPRLAVCTSLRNNKGHSTAPEDVKPRCARLPGKTRGAPPYPPLKTPRTGLRNHADGLLN